MIFKRGINCISFRRTIVLALSILAGFTFAQGGGSAAAKTPREIESAWRDLDSADATVRDAARRKIEAQPFETWKSRAIEETRPWASIEALRALCEACPRAEGPALRPHLCESITTLRIEQMSADQMMAAIRLTRLVCTRFGAPTEDERGQMLDLWTHLHAPAAPAKSSATGKDTDTASEMAKRAAPELKELVSLLSK